MDFSIDGDVGLGGSYIGAVGGLLDSFITNSTNASIASQNLGFQRETNAKNEALMRESWTRDDNAVQRRVADLKAAGLSPILAAGSAAGNSGAIQLNAPHNDFKISGLGLSEALSLASGLRTAHLQQVVLQKEAELKQKEIDHYGESPFWKNIEYLVDKFMPFLSGIFGSKGFPSGDSSGGSYGEPDPFGLNDPDAPVFNPEPSSSFLGFDVFDAKDVDRQKNDYAKDVLDYKGYDTTPSRSQEVVVAGHSYVVSDKFKQDARYFMNKLLDDNKVSSTYIISIADTLAQRYNYDKSDVIDYMFDLWDELHGSR